MRTQNKQAAFVSKAEGAETLELPSSYDSLEEFKKVVANSGKFANEAEATLYYYKTLILEVV